MFNNSHSDFPSTNSGATSFIASGNDFMFLAYQIASKLAIDPSAQMCPQPIPSSYPISFAKSAPTSSSISEVPGDDSYATLFPLYNIPAKYPNNAGIKVSEFMCPKNLGECHGNDFDLNFLDNSTKTSFILSAVIWKSSAWKSDVFIMFLSSG